MTVLNKYHGNIPPNAVYIGRGSQWGNPFIIGKDGTREEVIEKFEKMLISNIKKNSEDAAKSLAVLHGKDLVCFCAPKACHGHVLEKYAEQAHNHLK